MRCRVRPAGFGRCAVSEHSPECMSHFVIETPGGLNLRQRCTCGAETVANLRAELARVTAERDRLAEQVMVVRSIVTPWTYTDEHGNGNEMLRYHGQRILAVLHEVRHV